MKNISIWKDTLKNKINYTELDKDVETDILIIGGGLTGISNYYMLKKHSYNVMLVEQNEIGMGKTSNSTGKLSFLQNGLIDTIRNSLGDDIASKYLLSQIDAINLVVDIIKNEKIKCDLVKVKSNLYTNQQEEVDKIKDLASFLEKNNIKVNYDKLSIVKNLLNISVNDTYLFHPLKFIYGLIKQDDKIYEHTSIVKIKKKEVYYCYTPKHLIKVKKVIIASHYPYFNIPFLFPLKGYLEKSYLSASKSSFKNISLISYSKPFISMRTYQDYLIYLANSCDINKADDLKNFHELLKKVHDLKLEPDYLWSNSDIMTNDGLPYIGYIDHNMLIATGYNTWGMANSVLSSKIILDILEERNNPYIKLFSPSRINVEQLIKPFSNAYKSILGYLYGMQKQKHLLYKDKKIVYKKQEVLQRCPHLHCNVKLNEVEKTWDCPCHGSRFDLEGNCISGPSKENIKIND